MSRRVFGRHERSTSRWVLILAIVVAALGSGVTGYAAAKLVNGELGTVQLSPE